MSFDTFLESLDSVPPELERNFTLIKNLDKRIESIMVKVNRCVDRYEKSTKPSEKAAIRKETDELFDKLASYQEDKIGLAEQTYSLIDRNIKKLLSLTHSQETKGDEDIASPQQALGYEMPLDPNEPKYCICNGVSSGDMIACDNKECPIEWFHYSCLGITKAPEGQWFCLHCRPPNKKNNKRKNPRSKR